MRSTMTFALGALTLLGFASMPAQAGIRIGIGLPLYVGPGYYGPGYYGPYYGPGVLQSVLQFPPSGRPAVPVVVQQAPAVQQAPVVYQQAPAVSVYKPTTVEPPLATDAQIGQYLSALSDPSEQVRLDAVTHLGRSKAQSAVSPLTSTLAGDGSPLVREAAARALGLIGSSQAIPALRKAALSDSDRDVRHSAQFAIEVVQSNQ